MPNEKLTREEVYKFLSACEDLMRLGSTFSGNVRNAFADLKKTYDPVLKSDYVEKGAAQLLTSSLDEFERKMDSNLEAINRICTKGGKWFVFFLGKSLGSSAQSPDQQNRSHNRQEIRATRHSEVETNELKQAKKAGAPGRR
jgi:hypothetical protein